MLSAVHAGFQYPFHRLQHGFKAMRRDGCQHFGHDPIALLAFTPPQGGLQLGEGRRHLRKRRAVTQRARFAVDERNVMCCQS